MGLDVGTVIDAVGTSIADHGVVWTWERLIRPVWTELGGGSDDTDVPVAVERLFSRAVSQVLIAARRPRDRAPARVLLACADEEHHTLPLDALAAALAVPGLPAQAAPSTSIVAALKLTQALLGAARSSA